MNLFFRLLFVLLTVRSRALECLCQHPDASCEKARSGKPRNHAAYWNHFFDQHEYRHRDDPKHIHHAAYEHIAIRTQQQPTQ